MRQECLNKEKELALASQQFEVEIANERERLEQDARDRIFQMNVEIARLEEEAQNMVLTQD